MDQRYVLGTDVEGMVFAGDAIEYGPSGVTHVVDTESALYRSGSTLVYAVCGRPVRAWPDQPLDVEHLSAQIHDECSSLVKPGKDSERR